MSIRRAFIKSNTLNESVDFKQVSEYDLDEGIFGNKADKDLAKRLKDLCQGNSSSDKKSNKSGQSPNSKGTWKVVQTTGLQLTVADGFTSAAEAANYVKNHGGVTKLKAVQENLDEKITKENYEMNFQTILEELDRLYESDETSRPVKWVPDDFRNENGERVYMLYCGSTKMFSGTQDECKAYLEKHTIKESVDDDSETDNLEDTKESSDDEEILVDDEPIVEETQLVLECSKCGALVIKAEGDVEVDDGTDLANIEDACAFCEEAEGYKVIGTFTPSEASTTESLHELFGKKRYSYDISKKAKLIPYDQLEKGDLVVGEMDGIYDDEKGFYTIHRIKQEDNGLDIYATKNISGTFPGELHFYTQLDPENKVYVVKKADLKEGCDGELNELFGFGKKKKIAKSKNGSDSGDSDKELKVTIEVYDENGTKQFSQTFTEIPGKMPAEDQFNEVIKSNGVLNRYKSSSKKYDWSYVRKSNPPSPRDTDKYINPASRLIREAVNEEELEELLDVSPNISLSLDGGTGNDVDVL